MTQQHIIMATMSKCGKNRYDNAW